MARDIDKKTAIVLAAFGASEPEALGSIRHVRQRVGAAFPESPISLAFTSGFIRRVWRRRLAEPGFCEANPEICREMEGLAGPLAVIANLLERGHRSLAVQPLHIYAGEEYLNLKSNIEALNSIRTVKPAQQPFDKLVLGRPALGVPGPRHPYQEDLAAAVAALRPDVEQARARGAALVYLGHGNPFFSSGIYLELETALRREYPDMPLVVGVMEGFPGLERVLEELSRLGVKRLVLAPLLLVLGVHAREDLAGSGPKSWQSVLKAAGYQVECLWRGLGDLDSWADIYVNHLHDLFTDHGLESVGLSAEGRMERKL